MAVNESFDDSFLFDRLETSTIGAESSERTQREESSRHNIWTYLRLRKH